MKILVATALVFITFFACTKDNKDFGTASIFGEWKEFESYMDPGDGSGTYQPVEGILLSIKSDSTYTCSAQHYAWGSNGKISLVNDSTISINSNQSTTDFHAIFNKQNGILEVRYFCIEGCGSKFKKQNSGN